MNRVEIDLANREQFYENMMAQFDEVKLLQIAKQNRSNYEMVGQFWTEAEGSAAAEEAFDLSNNPARGEERDLIQGRTRSLSIGDVVWVTRNKICTGWLCAATGWIRI